MKKNDRDQYREFMKIFPLIAQVGLAIVLSIIISLFIGIWLDKIFELNIFKLIMIGIGLASGFFSAYKIIIKGLK